MLAAGSAVAAVPDLQLEIERISHPRLSARGVSIRLGGELGEGARLGVDELRLDGQDLGPATIRCRRFEFAQHRLACGGGRLDAPPRLRALPIDFALDPAASSGEVRLGSEALGRARLELGGSDAARLSLQQLDVAALVQGFVPPGWTVAGRADGELSLRRGEIRYRIELHDAGFGNPDGSRAAEGLSLAIDGRGKLDPPALALGIDWRAGGLYWAPLYRQAPARLEGHWRRQNDGQDRLDAELASDGMAGLSLTAEGRWGAWPPRRLSFDLRRADLARLGPELVAPWLEPEDPDGWRFAGELSARGEWSAGAIDTLDLALEQVGLGNVPRALGLGPVSGELRWGRQQRSGRMRIDGLAWRKLAFGPFELSFDGGPGEIVLAPLRIPLLDGALALQDVTWRDGPQGLRVQGSAHLEPLSMEALTVALELPRMSGQLSASLPGVSYREGVLAMDGALVIGVFGGYLRATGLQLLDPVGRSPRLRAELTGRNLDLGLLTDTFSFGHMTGQLDLEIGGLELVDWRPVGFDAWLHSSEGDFPRRISQRAVQNISALGGAGAAAAIQRSFLGLFETFGYRRFGFGCRLSGGVCETRGLGPARDGGGYVIVEGGGLPALNVIGYNRRVDWNDLLERVGAVIESNARPVVR